MKSIGVQGVKLSDYELSIAAQLVDPLSLSITWRDIGGLEDICSEVRETILLPMKKKHLFKESVLMQPPKGTLLLQAWNFILVGARPPFLSKGHFHWNITMSMGTFVRGAEVKTRATEPMACATFQACCTRSL